MPKYLPDTCECQAEFNIIDSVTTGFLIQSCGVHVDFDSMISFNRLKNNSINTISELFNMENKEITWNSNNGEITLTLIGFSESEIELIYSLNLNINIEIG